MKILILGDPNKFFRLEYVKNMKKNYPNYEFHVASNIELTTTKNPYDKVIHFKYNKTNGILNEFMRMINQVNQLEVYDYIHIHSANLFWLPLIKHFKKKCNKIILTYYGSDFYRAKRNRKFMFLIYNHLVDTITFSSIRMKNDVSRYIFNKAKSTVVPFGNSILGDIDKSLFKGKVKLKEEMGIPSQNIVITVGYNATKQQRHIEILEILEKVLNFEPNTTIILPLNYGNKEYQKKLHDGLGKFKLNIKTYDDFLIGKDIANLRAVSDIMIHMQDSDQFSASIVEYLYADNILINGSWIDYKELKEWGINYKEINSFEDLSSVLNDILKNYNSEKSEINSKKILKEKLGWDAVAKKWNELYR